MKAKEERTIIVLPSYWSYKDIQTKKKKEKTDPQGYEAEKLEVIG